MAEWLDIRKVEQIKLQREALENCPLCDMVEQGVLPRSAACPLRAADNKIEEPLVVRDVATGRKYIIAPKLAKRIKEAMRGKQ